MKKYLLILMLSLCIYDVSAQQKNKPSAAPTRNVVDVKKKFDSTFVYTSSLSLYKPGQPLSENNAYVDNYFWTTKASPYYDRRASIRATDESLRRLYYMAYSDTLYNDPPERQLSSGMFPDTIRWPHQKRTYGKFWYKPVFEIKDSSLFDVSNRFNYELKIPLSKGTSKNLRGAMQKDLEAAFGFLVSIEERQMPVWYVTISEKNKARLAAKNSSAGYKMGELEDGTDTFSNAEVRDIVAQLEILYGYSTKLDLIDQPAKQPPFIDATGLTDKIDYEYGAQYVHLIMDSFNGGPPFTFSQYRDMLNAIGFELIKGYKKMKVVVIRSPKQSL